MTVASRWLKVRDAAARVGRSEATIYRWRSEGIVTFRSGMVFEDDLVEADRQVRARREAQHHTHTIDVQASGLTVGTVRYNPVTGRIVGDLEPGMIIGGLETRRDARS